MRTLEQPHNPKKAILLYDGECSFCQSAAAHWERDGNEQVTILPAQGGAGEIYGISANRKPEAVILIENTGEIFFGAAAVFRLMEIRGSCIGTALWLIYRKAWLFRILADWGYRFVALHRFRLVWMKKE